MKILPVIGKQKEVIDFWQQFKKLGIQENYDNPDKILVLGGDGALLGAQRDYYKLNKSFVGVGFGSVNFLLNRSINTPDELHQKLEKNKWIDFPMQAIEVDIVTKNGLQKGIAFNDIYLKAVDSTSSIVLKLSTLEYPDLEVRGDGLILATPQGSTAYNSNAGGTILPLSSALWCLTGICTQEKLHAVVVQQEIQIDIVCGKSVLVTDNKIFEQVQRVRIRPSNFRANISFDINENFEQRRYNG